MLRLRHFMIRFLEILCRPGSSVGSTSMMQLVQALMTFVAP